MLPAHGPYLAELLGSVITPSRALPGIVATFDALPSALTRQTPPPAGSSPLPLTTMRSPPNEQARST